MKPASLVVAAGALLIASSPGCHNPSATGDLLLLHVETLDAPTTIAPGATLTVGLIVGVGGCLKFDHIQSLRTGSQVVLTVWGRDIRAGITDREIMCPRQFLEPHEYRLDPPFPSSFEVVVAEPADQSNLNATVTVR